VGFRFVSGLPHGAYFGVACVLAASLVPAARRAQAVARVMLGLTIATIVGVPAANFLGRGVGWRWTFVIVSALSTLTALGVLAVAPRTRVDAGAGFRRELGALTRRQVWLTLGIGAIGQGGLFSVYAYLASALQDPRIHAAPSALPTALMLFGTGMTLSLMFAGWLTDRIGMRAIPYCLLWSLFAMSCYALSIGHASLMLTAMFLVGCSGGLVAPIQTRLMDVAGDAQIMAAALNHSAFNVANAIGPALGGAALSLGGGWSATGWVGVGLALGGLSIWWAAVADQRRVDIEPAWS
jgi:DHA1 family inner membrane transport protein